MSIGKDIDINKVALTLEVDSEVIEGVRNGAISQVVLDSKEDELNLNELHYLVLTDGDDHCLTRILEVELEEPNDERNLWKVRFNIVPLLDEPKKYLMRWNPSISSFTDSDYENCVENMVQGMFRLNWSIHDWAGSSKRRLYVDLVCMNAIAPDEKPIVSLAMLQTAIPEFNWAKGHSGTLLPENVAEKMVGLMDKDAPMLN